MDAVVVDIHTLRMGADRGNHTEGRGDMEGTTQEEACSSARTEVAAEP